MVFLHLLYLTSPSLNISRETKHLRWSENSEGHLPCNFGVSTYNGSQAPRELHRSDPTLTRLVCVSGHNSLKQIVHHQDNAVLINFEQILPLNCEE